MKFSLAEFDKRNIRLVRVVADGTALPWQEVCYGMHVRAGSYGKNTDKYLEVGLLPPISEDAAFERLQTEG